ncbi:MAG: ABC transporter substrate-binding protein [Betaproteobacteria bacterium]|nr:ABC transporter substrate-binding protein [Betaproteobacteria bacterium]
MEKLNVGLVSKTYFYVSYWAALQQGLFSAADLDVQSTMLGNASQIEPLESGKLDVAMATPEGVLQNTAAGGKVRCIAGHTGRLSHFIIAQPHFKKVEDLRGALVGILSMTEGTFFHVKSVLASHGLKYPDDYRVKETGGAPPRHKALIEKTIDMGFQSIPLVYAEESLGFSNLGDVSDYVPDWQFNTVNAHLDNARERRDAIVRFLGVMLRANDWVYTHRAEAAAVAAREMDISQDHAERGWDYYTGKGVLTRDLEMNMKGLARVIESQQAAGLLPTGAASDPEAYMAREFLAAARSK